MTRVAAAQRLAAVIAGVVLAACSTLLLADAAAAWAAEATGSRYTSAADSLAATRTPPATSRASASFDYDDRRHVSRGRVRVPLGSSAARGGTGLVKYDADVAIGQLTSRGAKASDLAKVAESQGWRRVQNPNGPVKYVDANDVTRLTLKSGSARAPGSNFPHVEIRDAAGQRVDPYGNPVSRRSPGNHTRIDWDLP